MKTLFEVKDVDRAFYAERLREFLPRRIIDIHTHVWLEAFRARRPSEPVRSVTWPARVARDNSAADLEETYRLIFPGNSVTPLIFGNILSRDDDVAAANAYVSDNARSRRWPALVWSMPFWTAAELEERIRAGGFIGAKSYLSLADPDLPEKDICIYDFFPPRQLEALDRTGLILMLHIPRDGRLRDPVNLAQLLEIEERYPRLQVIVAHVGRAYCPEDIGDAFKVLAKTRRMCFDISANTNYAAFRALIEGVGPRRILFGSDLPIARMRMRRVCENGNYVNLVPPGLYGDVSGDRHMREAPEAEAGRLTFFLYEELDAFRRAAADCGLTRDDLELVFFGNAARIIENAGFRLPPADSGNVENMN